ncbi:hypothetical protein FB451DRAFT_1187874 [Mycena latifolia]|nr:hypothetical protein FB451DRAFT_1187874 [Mycena latifolia]
MKSPQQTLALLLGPLLNLCVLALPSLCSSSNLVTCRVELNATIVAFCRTAKPQPPKQQWISDISWGVFRCAASWAWPAVRQDNASRAAVCRGLMVSLMAIDYQRLFPIVLLSSERLACGECEKRHGRFRVQTGTMVIHWPLYHSQLNTGLQEDGSGLSTIPRKAFVLSSLAFGLAEARLRALLLQEDSIATHSAWRKRVRATEPGTSYFISSEDAIQLPVLARARPNSPSRYSFTTGYTPTLRFAPEYGSRLLVN